MTRMFYTTPKGDYRTLGKVIDTLTATYNNLMVLLDTIPDTPENQATLDTIDVATDDINDQIIFLQEVQQNIVDRETDDYKDAVPVQFQINKGNDWLQKIFQD